MNYFVTCEQNCVVFKSVNFINDTQAHTWTHTEHLCCINVVVLYSVVAKHGINNK